MMSSKVEAINKYIKCLDCITKEEWSSLKIVIDEGFTRKQKELDPKIKLSAEEMGKVTHSIFG